MVGGLLQNAFGDEVSHCDVVEPGIVAQGDCKDHTLKRVEHHGDPWVQGVVFEAVEGFPEAQVADNVEGDIVVPVDNVDDSIRSVFLVRRDFLVEPRDKQINVRFDNGLLGFHTFFCEGVAHYFPHPRMGNMV